MLWANDQNSSPNNCFSALVQLKFHECCLGKLPNLKEQYSTIIHDDLSKLHMVKVEKSTCFRTKQPFEWYLPHHPVFHAHKPGKVRRVPNGAANFHGYSFNYALLIGRHLLRNLVHVRLFFRSTCMPFQLTSR